LRDLHSCGIHGVGLDSGGCTRRHMSDVFFFTDTATTEIYTLSLHDALPISSLTPHPWMVSTTLPTIWRTDDSRSGVPGCDQDLGDRKSTRLNSSHVAISYAVFCLKKKTLN